MCLLRNIRNAVPKLRMIFCRGFTIVLPRRVAITILSLSMILILLMCWTVQPLLSCHALITEVTLVGGGDLTLSALLDLLMVAFGAAGMDGAVRNQAAATGTQTVSYVGQLLNRYLETALDAVLPAVWSKRISDGLSILANGTLYLDSDATAAIADFQNWAWSEDGANLISFGPTRSGPYLSYGGMDVVTLDCSIRVGGLTTPVYISDVFRNKQGNLTYYDAFTEQTYAYAGYYTVGNEAYKAIFIPEDYSGTKAGYVSLRQDGSVFGWSASTTITRGQWWVTGANGIINLELGYPVSHFESNPVLPDISEFVGAGSPIGDVTTFVGPTEQGQGTELPLGDVVTVSSDTAATMHLLNYLRAASSAYAGTGTAQLPVTDVGTGEEELLPLSVPLDTPIGVTGVTDAAIDQSGAAAGTDAVARDFLGTDEYTMDLTQFFPFCIPFDIVALYQKFESEADAPVIDWPIPIPGQEEPYLLHLDFSVFDSLAVWVRRLELIAFAVGLMVATKKLIQGGD